jgi:uncharacterized membrane protein
LNEKEEKKDNHEARIEGLNMKFKTVSLLAAILIFLNAFLFMVAPVFSLSLLGRETNLTGIMITRLSGACALGLAVIVWLTRNVRYPEVQRMVSIAMVTTFCILVVIDLGGILTGAVNQMGWIFFLVDLFFSVGFTFSIFTDGGHT